MTRLLRFLRSRQFWVGFAAVNCWYDAVLVCGGGSPNWLLAGLAPVLLWALLHLIEGRWREREAHIERAHMIARDITTGAHVKQLIRDNGWLMSEVDLLSAHSRIHYACGNLPTGVILLPPSASKSHVIFRRLAIGGATGMEHDDCGIMPELILYLTDVQLTAMLLDQVNELVMRGRVS
jgi:hypothetical protein